MIESKCQLKSGEVAKTEHELFELQGRRAIQTGHELSIHQKKKNVELRVIEPVMDHPPWRSKS
jgi:hypothetical protein